MLKHSPSSSKQHHVIWNKFFVVKTGRTTLESERRGNKCLNHKQHRTKGEKNFSHLFVPHISRCFFVPKKYVLETKTRLVKEAHFPRTKFRLSPRRRRTNVRNGSSIFMAGYSWKWRKICRHHLPSLVAFVFLPNTRRNVSVDAVQLAAAECASYAAKNVDDGEIKRAKAAGMTIW